MRLYKIIFLLIGLFTLGYMVYNLGLDTIASSIGQVGWWFLPIIGSWLIVYVCNALAFDQVIHEPLLPDTKLPFGRVLYVTITGYIINYITPFVALGGEPYRVMNLRTSLGVEKASSSVLLYGLMHMFSHVIFWLLSIVFLVLLMEMDNYMLLGFLSLFLIGLLLCYWFTRIYRNGFTIQTVRYLKKLPFIGSKISAFERKHDDKLQQIDTQISAFYGERKGRFYTALGWELLSRIISCAEIYFAGNALQVDMSFLQAVLISAGSSLIANIAFFFPMQLGVREGGLAFALKSLGFASSIGLIIGLVVRIRELVWIGIGLLLMALKQKNKQTAYD